MADADSAIGAVLVGKSIFRYPAGFSHVLHFQEFFLEVIELGNALVVQVPNHTVAGLGHTGAFIPVALVFAVIPVGKVQCVLHRIVVIKSRIGNELTLRRLKVVNEDVAAGLDKSGLLSSAKQREIIVAPRDIDIQEKPLNFFSLMVFQEVQILRFTDYLTERPLAVDFELIGPIGEVICVFVFIVRIQEGHISIGRQ